MSVHINHLSGMFIILEFNTDICRENKLDYASMHVVFKHSVPVITDVYNFDLFCLVVELGMF